MENDSIGAALARFRESRKLTQKDFAALLDVGPTWQCDLENGRRMPSLNYINRLISAFALSDGQAVRWHKRGARAQGWDV